MEGIDLLHQYLAGFQILRSFSAAGQYQAVIFLELHLRQCQICRYRDLVGAKYLSVLCNGYHVDGQTASAADVHYRKAFYFFKPLCQKNCYLTHDFYLAFLFSISFANPALRFRIIIISIHNLFP